MTWTARGGLEYARADACMVEALVPVWGGDRCVTGLEVIGRWEEM